MRTDEMGLSFLSLARAAAVGVLMVAGLAAGAPKPAATTRPAPKPLGDLPERWKAYKLAWAGGNVQRQLLTDRRLVGGILGGAPAEVAVLRGRMIGEYERLSKLPAVDDYRSGRLASQVALAWTRLPTGKALPPVRSARNTRRTCTESCRWAERAIAHFAAGIQDARWKAHEAFLPGAVAGMMSLIPSRALWIDRPGQMRDRLQSLRPRLEKLLTAAGDNQQQHSQQIETFYRAIEPYGRLEADKQAVGKLLAGFRTAYNQRDDKTFVALWPAGHQATRSLKNRTLASRIPPQLWKIDHWECVYVGVEKGMALAYVVSQYRSKGGKLHPPRLQRFPAKRHKKVGWKLN